MNVQERLEAALHHFETPAFIAADPISIPHRFTKKADIEIAGLFAATLAWGHRKMILRNADRLLAGMDNAPHDFILNHAESDLKRFLDFAHRTFGPTDLLYFIHFLRHHYQNSHTLETAFTAGELSYNDATIERALIQYREAFFVLPEAPARTGKHVPSPLRGSACKRLCMFLRWMVRPAAGGVDFGIWNIIQPAQLVCPLDVHSSRVARQLGLLKREATDWKAALELTTVLREMCPEDPVKYDLALFGMGVEGKL